MIFYDKEIKLKDGTKCTLRSAEGKDAQNFIDYHRTVAGETHYLLRNPEEITITPEKQSAIINHAFESNNEVMINAFIDGELAGNIHLYPVSNNLKEKHRASLGITVKKQFWGKGLGKALFEEILNCASKIGYEQVELNVYSDNKKAQNMYKKYGFEVWGCTKNAFKLSDGTYCDDMLMGKIL